MVLLAQLVRAFVCGTKGREFDSHITHYVTFGNIFIYCRLLQKIIGEVLKMEKRTVC